MNTPTEAAIKCAHALYPYWSEARFTAYGPDIAATVDRETNLPALTALAMAAQGVIDAGRPHGIFHTCSRPDGCECEQCETWDTLKRAVDALEQRAESGQ